MKHIIFKTYSTFTGLILRCTLGLIFLPHGLQKTVGLYGGAGLTGTIKVFTEQLHLPAASGAPVSFPAHRRARSPGVRPARAVHARRRRPPAAPRTRP